MPLEIRELVIKATVDGQDGEQGAPQGGGADEEAKEQLVNLCVEKVLEILKEKAER